MSDSHPLPESYADLVARIREGDEEAFEQLYRRLVAPLNRFAYSYVRLEAAAEDLVQDVFISVWRRRAGLVPGSEIRQYLYGAVRNAALRVGRDDGRRQLSGTVVEEHRVAMGEAPALPDTLAEHHELEVKVHQAILELPPRCREAYILVRQHGMSYREAAATLGIAPKTIENQVGIALKMLRSALSGYLGK